MNPTILRTLFSVPIMSMVVVLNASGGPPIINSVPANVQAQSTVTVPDPNPVSPAPNVPIMPEPVIPNAAKPRPDPVLPNANQPLLPRHFQPNSASGQTTSPSQTTPPSATIPPSQTIPPSKTVPPGPTIPPGPALIPPIQPLLPGKPILPANPPQTSVVNHTN